MGVNNNTFPRSLEKELLLDIDTLGGIEHASVKAVCDAKPDTFGSPHSLQLKRISRASYISLLKTYGISTGTRPTTTSSRSTVPPAASTLLAALVTIDEPTDSRAA